MDVNGDFGAHAGHNLLAAGAVKRDEHRDALTDFGEVAAGIVLSGQQREAASGGINDLLHMAAIAGIFVGVDMDVDLLAHLDVIQSVLIDVGDDVEVVQVGELGQWHTRRDDLVRHHRKLQDGAIDGTGDLDALDGAGGKRGREGGDGLTGFHMVAQPDVECADTPAYRRADRYYSTVDLCIISTVVHVVVVEHVCNAAADGEDGENDEQWDEDHAPHGCVLLL